MNRQDWYDLASVYMAGAKYARGWTYNTAKQQDAEILTAMADRCIVIAESKLTDD